MGVSKVTLNGATLMDVTENTVDDDNLLYGYTALAANGEGVTGVVVTASASDTSPQMDGTASAGTATTYSRGDHVHPTDISRASSTHIHGNITNDGKIASDTAVASGDKIVITDSSSSNAIARSAIAFGSSTTTFLDNTGSWSTPSGAVTSVNSKTGAVSLTASDVSAIPTSQKGAASGVAELDATGKVPSSQLPGYVDDVLEYDTLSDFPATGESGKIYIDISTNTTYRWSGSTYVAIGSSLALGETSSTAYRGDRGKIAYDHATDANRLTTAQSSGFYKIATTTEGHVASVAAVTKSDITDLGIPSSITIVDWTVS